METDLSKIRSPRLRIALRDERWSRMGEEEGPIKTLYRNNRGVRYCEGMENNEISLGPVEDGLYFRG